MPNTLRLVTLLAWGLCVPAYAQAPTFSIPAIPGAETNNAAPALPAAPTAPSNSAPMPPPLPGLEKLTAEAAPKTEEAKQPEKVAEAKDAKPADAKAETAPADPKAELAAALGAPAPAPGAEVLGPVPAPTPLQPAMPYSVAPPPLTLNAPPGQNITAAPPPLPPMALPIPQPLGLAATAIPEPAPAAPKKTTPTWKEVLKPSYKPKETSFNYRRQVLPPQIYRAQYDRNNRHLPIARTYATYDHAFILAAARNDVNGVRAMLTDGHRNANLMNADGDSVLIVALRHGALATARLLIAYGADVGYSGSGGWSAMDYANYWGDPELIRAVSKGA